MDRNYFQIRVCLNPDCRLRYPLMAGHPFGKRCPLCLGETQVLLTQALSPEREGAAELPRSPGPSVLLDNVRSAWNVGSILRSADGFGFSHAFLCGITPTPEHTEVRKTALGAQGFVSWSAHKDAVKLASRLREQNHLIVALESVEGAIPLQHLDLGIRNPEKIVLVVGSEVTGVDPGLLEMADRITYLPMRGQKRSFNVAVAFGAAAFELCLKLSSGSRRLGCASGADETGHR